MDILVAGAGSTTVNGIYLPSGTSGGKPLYKSGTNSIDWWVTLWRLRAVNNIIYYSGNDVATPNLVTTWVSSSSDYDPVPTVTAYYSNLYYELFFDWDGNDVLDTTNEAPYMVRYAIDRGRDTLIQPSGGGFTPQEIGKLYLTLDNSSGRFSPWATTDIAPSGGPITPGHMMQLKAYHGSTDDVLFTGYVSDIQESGYKDTVNIVCEDYWRLFSEGTYFERTYRPTYLYTHMNNLLTDLGYSYGTTVSTDDTAIGFSRYAWCDNLSHKKEVENITGASLGRAYITGDGIFHYKALTTTDNAVLTITQDEVLKEIYLPTPWENTRDKVVLKARDYQAGVPNNLSKGILSNNTPIKIDGNATMDRWINYALSTTDELINGAVYGLFEKLNWSANAAANGSGADVTSDFTVTPSFENFKLNLSIINGSSDAGYFYNYSVKGTSTDGTYEGDPDLSTEFIYITEYDKEFYDTSDSVNSFVLQSPYLNVAKFLDAAYATYIASSTDGRVGTQGDIDRLNDVGNTLLNYLSTPRAYPTIQMQGRYSDQFILDIEDKVTLTLGNFGINSDYRVLKITHEAEGNCQDVLSTFKLYPVMTRST
jgi:hypothetical protein